MKRGNTLLYLLIFVFVAPVACFDTSESGIAPSQIPTPREREVLEDSTEVERLPQIERLLDSRLPLVPTIELGLATKPGEDDGILTGDLSCVGNNLPSAPSGQTRSLTGQTVYFGTRTSAPGTVVRAIDGKGQALADTVSDDSGYFDLSYPDTSDNPLALLELSQPGFYPVWYHSTHPNWSWVEGVAIGVVSQAEVDLIEMAAGIELDLSRGSLVGEIFDCAGEDEVAGVHVTIEGHPVDVHFSTTGWALTLERDSTTSASQFFVFNLEPGTYDLALWGFAQPDDDAPVLLNRISVNIAAGVVSAAYIYPE